jgi:hypothetical protein
MKSQAYVKNAADAGQVREAEHKQVSREKQHENDLKAMLSLPESRRVIWNWLGKCKVNGSIWEPSAKIHYNSGQQDIGHFIMGEVVTAGEEFYYQMMTENKGVNNNG